MNDNIFDTFQKELAEDPFGDPKVIKKKAGGDNELLLIKEDDVFCVKHRRNCKEKEYKYHSRTWAENRFRRIEDIFLD